MVAQDIIDTVQSYLRSLADSGLAPHFAVLFGSNARGEAQPLSDIDLVVVAPVFDNATGRGPIDLLWRTAARVDSRIEPIPCGVGEWRDDDARAILEIARREGRIINCQVA